VAHYINHGGGCGRGLGAGVHAQCVVRAVCVHYACVLVAQPAAAFLGGSCAATASLSCTLDVIRYSGLRV
jgi:hypothetical protein